MYYIFLSLWGDFSSVFPNILFTQGVLCTNKAQTKTTIPNLTHTMAFGDKKPA